jgi:ubiquinone/menaquinone biosynthesis C-methylase UbiE
MNRFNPGNVQVSENWPVTLAQDLLEADRHTGLPGPHQPADFADRLYACEALKPVACGSLHDEIAEPYSLQWFLDIENQRHGRQGRWIPRLLEFSKHSGDTLLGLGHGLGTDWLQYARHGASVIVCSPSTEQLALIRRNFELRNLPGQFLHTPFTDLPLDSASIDVACISSLLHEVAEPNTIINEIWRVLRPGGKVLAVTPAAYDVDWWFACCFPWLRWLSPRPASNRASATRFSGKQLRRLFARFVDHRIWKRHLRRSEVPHIWRWLPRSLLERVMGRVLVLKAFKPLTCHQNQVQEMASERAA